MKKRKSFAISLFIGTLLISQISMAGNVKKKYINVSKEGGQATASDLGNLATSYGTIETSLKNLAYDSKGNHQKIMGNAVLSADGLVLDGGDYADMGNVLPNSYTKEAYVKLTDFNDSNNILSSEPYHAFWFESHKLASMHVNSAGSFVTVYDSVEFPLNKWVHVATTYNAATTTLVLYKDGVEIGRRTDIPNLRGNTVSLSRYGGGNYLHGRLKEVRLWKTVRTPEQIKAYKDKTITGLESDLVFYYPLTK